MDFEIKCFQVVGKDCYSDHIRFGAGGWKCEIHSKGKLEIICSGETKKKALAVAIDILEQWEWI